MWFRLDFMRVVGCLKKMSPVFLACWDGYDHGLFFFVFFPAQHDEPSPFDNESVSVCAVVCARRRCLHFVKTASGRRESEREGERMHPFPYVVELRGFCFAVVSCVSLPFRTSLTHPLFFA